MIELAEIIAQGILIGLTYVLKIILEYMSPIMLWGSKTAILIYALIYFLSKDNKALSSGIKVFFIYFIFCFFKGVIA